MIGIAAVRMVKSVIADPATGVEAVLDALEYDDSDARPERLAAILDPTADDAAVTQNGVADWPILVVTVEQPSSTAAPAGVSNGLTVDVPNCLVSIVYATRDTADAAQAWRDTDYTMQALVRCLMANLFAATPAAAAARQRGKVAIHRLNNMTYGPMDFDVPGGRVTGALLLDLYIRANQ